MRDDELDPLDHETGRFFGLSSSLRKADAGGSTESK